MMRSLCFGSLAAIVVATVLRVLPAVAQEAAPPVAVADWLKETMALVNGRAITRGEFYRRLETAAGERVLADLIARAMLLDAFDRSGLQLTEPEILSEIQKLKAPARTEKEWGEYLKQQDMNEAEFREFLVLNLKVKKLSEKDVKVTDEALRTFFEANKEKFARPESVVLSEIVVASKARADEVAAELRLDAGAFPELARRHSESTYTRERGGRRLEEPLASVEPEALRGAVASLQVGQVSRPVEVEGQWYIVRLEQRLPARAANFAAAQDEVCEAYVFSQARQVAELVEELRRRARVEILDPHYEDLRLMFGPPPRLPQAGP